MITVCSLPLVSSICLGESDAIPRLYVLIEGTHIFIIRGLISNFATVHRVLGDLFVLPHILIFAFIAFLICFKFKDCFYCIFCCSPIPVYLLTERSHCLPTKQIQIKWRFLPFVPWPEVSLGGRMAVSKGSEQMIFAQAAIWWWSVIIPLHWNYVFLNSKHSYTKYSSLKFKRKGNCW